jgi:hypothetical protein
VRSVRTLVVGASAAVAVALAAAAPAIAAPGDTTTTFTVTGGALAITVPGSATIGSGGPAGTTISGQLGAISVTDDRAVTPATWSTTVTSTDFTTNGGGTGQVVVAGTVLYSSGAVTGTGTGTLNPSGAPTSIDGLTWETHTGGTGLNTATWNPTLAIPVPSANVAGTYTGTVNHSVA